MTQFNWLAAYLYYSEPWTDLLLEAVEPLVRQAFQRGLAKRYFFIRYWERGPHIRLRFEGDPQRLESDLKPLIQSHFEAYFAGKPSQRPELEWMDQLPPESRWLPNNSVHFVEYEPEIERYGGPAAMIIAEYQFQACSDAVFTVMAQSQSWDYDRALGAAIQLHLGFAHGLGMTLDELRWFAGLISHFWMIRAYQFEPADSDADKQEKSRVAQDLFARTFESQKEVLVPFCRTLWQALEEKVTFEQEWLNRWVAAMTDVGTRLDAAHRQGRLIRDGSFLKNMGEESAARADRRPWLVFESFVHMANNRLGILNRDEAFLGYLIKSAIEAM